MASTELTAYLAIGAPLWQQEKNVFSIFSEAVFMQRSITFISTLRGLDWWGVQSIIAGRAPESGSAFQTMMSLYRLILIGSNGGGHSPAKFGRVLRKVRDVRDLPHIRRQSRKFTGPQVACHSPKSSCHFCQYQLEYREAERILLGNSLFGSSVSGQVQI